MVEKSNLQGLIKRALMTLLIIFIYVAGLHIPLPFVEITSKYHDLVTNTPLSLMSIMSGASFARLSIFSIGLNPFMIAIFVLQILTLTKVFGFDALSTDQVQIVQQFIILILAIVQSTIFTFSMITTRDLVQDLIVILLLTAGSMLVFWLCIMNIKFGVGGTAPVILVNIVTSAITSTIGTIVSLENDNNFVWNTIITLALIVLLIYFWAAFSHAYYPLQSINTMLPSYAEPVVIPIGLNMGAMMTYMIGMGILTLPTMLTNYFSPDSIVNNIYFDAGISFILVFILFYFFTFMQFDPREEAKRLRNTNGYILNVRPGRPTQKYLTRLLLVISLPGALLNSLMLTFGLLGTRLLGKYAGISLIVMNVVMITMFGLNISDQIKTLMFPYKYEQLKKEE